MIVPGAPVADCAKGTWEKRKTHRRHVHSEAEAGARGFVGLQSNRADPG